MLTFEFDSARRCHVLRCEVTLTTDHETLFEFFSDAFQLEHLTPPFLHFKVQTRPPIQIEQGTLIDYRLKLHGLPIRWRTEISEWNPPFSFTDRQIRGPYRLWQHRHIFQPVTDGTLAIDEVLYKVPGGRTIERLIVRNDLRRIFDYRCRQMIDRFGSADDRPDPLDTQT
ncbi:MAG: hypothetical protein Fues2KO_32740 [Fuerstiella sp.]